MHRLDLLILVARGDFLRAFDGLLRLDGQFLKSQHTHLVSSEYDRKGAGALAGPLLSPLGQNYLPAADAAIGGVPMLTLICFGLASSFLGIFSVSTQF